LTRTTRTSVQPLLYLHFWHVSVPPLLLYRCTVHFPPCVPSVGLSSRLEHLKQPINRTRARNSTRSTRYCGALPAPALCLMASRAEALALARALMRAGRDFPDYNMRECVQARGAKPALGAPRCRAARWPQADSRPAARAQVRVQACAAGVQGARGGHGACAACPKHPALGGGGTKPYAPLAGRCLRGGGARRGARAAGAGQTTGAFASGDAA